ncbi:DUF3592 domain-containing protein [Amycolatopsis sp. MEPSY49]|uniref:DUF3592 domain-containing protein n=1 Tax=Amycolatopsis sp. MEPSY49 TaxID=3151600 RepID=UPI003EF4D161
MDLDGEAVAHPTPASRTAWDLDALPAWCAAVIGSVMPGVLVAARIVDGDRRAAALPDFGPWSAPEEPLDGGSVVDFAEETGRLRRSARRAAVFAAVWCAVVAGFVVLAAAAPNQDAGGAGAVGEVVGVVQPTGGPGPRLVRVELRVDGTTRTVAITRDDVGGYSTGQVVTVVYDPPGLRNPRLADERAGGSSPTARGVVALVPLVPFAYVGSAAMFEALSRRRRYLAVRRTGWRRAAVTVVPDRSMVDRRQPVIDVRYRDGSTIVLRAAVSTHGARKMKDPPDRIAWVGGWGRDMVVLFPYRPKEERPYAVPAFALSVRENA